MVSSKARVVELVDTGDLKSPGYCSCAGSSPAPGTTQNRLINEATIWRHSQVAKARACKALIPGSNPGVASINFILSGDGRAVECTGLENQRGSHLREFESPSPGHKLSYIIYLFFLLKNIIPFTIHLIYFYTLSFLVIIFCYHTGSFQF